MMEVLQAKVSEQWALRPSQEDARLASDMQLLQQDYQLIIMVHQEAIKQVSLQLRLFTIIISSSNHRHTLVDMYQKV